MNNKAVGGVVAATTYVHFTCQSCCQPLKLDPSFHDLNPEMLDELTAKLQQQQLHEMQQEQQQVLPTSSVNVAMEDANSACVVLPATESPFSGALETRQIPRAPPAYLSPNGSAYESFVMLARSHDGDGKKGNLSYRVKMANKLFDVLSEQTDVDHPLCPDCTDLLLDTLDARYLKTKHDRDVYKDFLTANFDGHDDSCETNTDGKQPGEAVSDKELEDLLAEEVQLKAELIEIERTREKVRHELDEVLEAEEQTLASEEERYWKEYNEFQLQLQHFNAEKESVEIRYRHANQQLEQLKKTNVYNDTFHVWHDGHFGTINNFRLGRLPSQPVDWSEINAAWGQTVLLLHTLAQKMNFTFERFKLVPLGSYSRLEKLSDRGTGQILELYGSAGLKFFWASRFDAAMVAFLDCLQQFKEHVESKDVHFKLPYKIAKDKIGDMSIRIQFNNEETWTKALKFMLTNLKWILAWVSKLHPGTGTTH